MFQKILECSRRFYNVPESLMQPQERKKRLTLVSIQNGIHSFVFFKTKGAHDNPKVNAIIVLKGSPERKFVSH